MVFVNPNITTAIQFVQYANTVTGSTFWNFFVIMMTGLVFMGLKGFKTEAALPVTAFFMLFVSFFLWVLGLVNQLYIIAFAVAAAVGFFFNT